MKKLRWARWHTRPTVTPLAAEERFGHRQSRPRAAALHTRCTHTLLTSTYGLHAEELLESTAERSYVTQNCVAASGRARTLSPADGPCPSPATPWLSLFEIHKTGNFQGPSYIFFSEEYILYNLPRQRILLIFIRLWVLPTFPCDLLTVRTKRERERERGKRKFSKYKFYDNGGNRNLSTNFLMYR